MVTAHAGGVSRIAMNTSSVLDVAVNKHNRINLLIYANNFMNLVFVEVFCMFV